MISLTQLATTFQNGLNTLLAQIPEVGNVEFQIWATAGQDTAPYREGNSVTEYIPASLRISSSANEAAALVMGVNGLVLEFAVPVKQPKTQASQTAQDLQRVVNYQYPFLDTVINVINSYFQIAQNISLTDESGTVYSIGLRAGTTISGAVDLASVVGECVYVTVYIECTFVEGGVNSKAVIFTMDGQSVPYQSFNYARSSQLSSDVYSTATNVTNTGTATALSVEFSFPANSDTATNSMFNYILFGGPNTAHFVELQSGTINSGADILSGSYVMTVESAKAAAQGVTIVGLSCAMVESVDDVEMLNFPDTFYQIGYFEFSAPVSVISLSFTELQHAPCWALIGRTLRTAAGYIDQQLTPDDFVYDEETGIYYLYIVTLGAATITKTMTEDELTIIQTVANNG